MDVKRRLNRAATAVLLRAGYSDARSSALKREAWWWLVARSRAARRAVPVVPARQVVWTGEGRVELLDAAVPRAARGELTVRAAATIVSPGTERAQYLRLPNTGADPPFVPGYSGAGIVEAVGRGVEGFAVGDRVAVRGLPHQSVATVAAGRAHRIPDGVTLEDAAFVQLGVICRQAVRHAALLGGERVCIVGGGLIGSLIQRLAAAEGAGETTVVARSRRTEALARAAGAVAFLATGEGDDPRGVDADVVFEATGAPAAVATAIAAARDGGIVVLAGSARGVTPDVPLGEVVRRRLRLVGAHVETLTAAGRLAGSDLQAEEADRFLALLASGAVDVAPLVSLVADPAEAELLYRTLVGAGDVTAARFDWTAVDAPAGRRLPDVRARGVAASHPRLAAAGAGDPFAGAEGRLRIALLGCGDIAMRNAAAAVAAPNVELVAAYDPATKLAEEVVGAWGGTVLPSVEAVVARDDVDAVFICVPHHLHLPLAAQAAAAGKHLIVEKPLAQDLAAALELAAVADDAGVVLSICFPQRYEPQVQEARRLVEAGAIGRVAGTSVRLLMDKPPSYWVGGFSGRSTSTWRANREQAGGGVLIMNLSHYVDLIRYVGGVEAETVAASVAAVDGPAEVEDTVSVSIAYRGGGVGNILGSAALRGLGEPESDVQLWGPEGRIVLEPRAAAMSLHALPGRASRRWYALPAEPIDVRAVYLSRLATAIARGESPDVTAADALAVQAVLEAAYRSAELAQPVRPAELLRA